MGFAYSFHERRKIGMVIRSAKLRCFKDNPAWLIPAVPLLPFALMICGGMDGGYGAYQAPVHAMLASFYEIFSFAVLP
jgi:hypothetical protein